MEILLFALVVILHIDFMYLYFRQTRTNTLLEDKIRRLIDDNGKLLEIVYKKHNGDKRD
jgi:hypothetical protein